MRIAVQDCMAPANESATTVERLNIARQSSDLGVDLGRRKDADYLTAAGIAAHRRRLGGSLMRLHDRKHSSLVSTIEDISMMVRALNLRLNWRLNSKSIDRVAQTALAYHISPVCTHCKGRAFELIPGSVIKSTTPCPHCQGTGRHPLPRRHRAAISYILGELEAADHDTERHIEKVMR